MFPFGNQTGFGTNSRGSQRAQTAGNTYQNAEHYQRHDVEDALARELQKIKLTNEAKQREIEKIYSESEDLKLLKNKIMTAQVTKERTRQIAEGQQRRIETLRNEAELEDNILRKCQEEKRLEGEKERILQEQRLQGKFVLQQQMLEKKRLEEEAHELYLQEKGQVNQIVQKIIYEDQKAYEDDKRKKKIAFGDMMVALAEKAERKAREKIHEQLENQKYKEFYQQKEQMHAEIKKKQQELEAQKAIIFQRLKAEEERRRKEKEQLEDLRMDLYREEYEALERKKDREEKEKRERTKIELQQAERQLKQEKADRLEDERRMEMEFRERMMLKFAEEAKMEQLSVQKRRMKELEHKREVERMWTEKLEMYREIRERELEDARKQSELNSYKEELIRLEKERLLKEYLGELAGFMPKGLLQNNDDAKFLGSNNPQAQRTGYASNFKLM